MLVVKCSLFSLLIFLTFGKRYVSGYNFIDHDYVGYREAMFSRNIGTFRVIDEELCQMQRNASDLLLNILSDATGKLPSGILIGNVNSLGQYQQCLSVDEIVDDVHVKGKYCMNTFSVTVDPSENEEANSLSLRTRSIDSSIALSGLLGICVPSACSSISGYDEDSLEILGSNVTLQELFCREKNDKPFAAHDLVAVIIFSILGLILALSTTYHLYNILYRNKDIPKILKSFSVHHNMCRLLNIPKGPNPLSCINGIRAISMAWVVLGHSYQRSVAMVPIENPFDLFEWVGQFRSTFIVAATLAVDTFLYMTAFLLTWSILKKFQRAGDFAKTVPMLYLNRYIRLTPLLAAVMLLQISFLNHVTDGPDWRLVSESKDNCLKNWWINLLYVQNYVRANEGLCLPHSWYLAVDMQLYWASPILIVFLFAGIKRAFIALSVALCAALGITIGICFYYNFTTFTEGLTVHYYNTLSRASPFVLGMIVGYVVFLMKQRDTKITSKTYMLIHWILSAGLMIAPFVGAYTVENIETSQATLNFYLAWQAPSWSLGVGGIIFACMQGFGGPVNWLLSLDLWTIPARLSYATYLLHYPIQFTQAAARHSAFRFTNADVLKNFISDMAITLLASLILTLLVDAPFAELSNILFAKLLGKKKTDDRERKPKDVEDDAEVTKDMQGKVLPNKSSDETNKENGIANLSYSHNEHEKSK